MSNGNIHYGRCASPSIFPDFGRNVSSSSDYVFLCLVTTKIISFSLSSSGGSESSTFDTDSFLLLSLINTKIACFVVWLVDAIVDCIGCVEVANN